MKSLDFNQMEKVQGGVPIEEYCATLKAIAQNNLLVDGAAEGASYGAALCKDAGIDIYN